MGENNNKKDNLENPIIKMQLPGIENRQFTYKI